MVPSAAPWTGFRRAALPLGPVLLLLPAAAVRAQRLLTLVPGVAAPSTADDLGPSIGPVPTAVQVDLDLLRSGPAWLETPTPDGSMLWAERSVFEERIRSLSVGASETAVIGLGKWAFGSRGGFGR